MTGKRVKQPEKFGKIIGFREPASGKTERLVRWDDGSTTWALAKELEVIDE